MSHGNKRQRDKKNKNRIKAGDVGFKSSIQRNYGKKKELSTEETLQVSLF